MIKEFLTEIDKKWQPLGDELYTLQVFGSAALFLQTSYNRITKDMDVLEIESLSQEAVSQLKQLAGRGSQLFKTHRVYLDIVKPAVPFFPPKPIFHQLDLNLNHFRIKVLDIIDVVVSKLKIFRPQDVSDIEFLANQNLLNNDPLVSRFKVAIDSFQMDARAEDLPQFVDNLHIVQRDFLGVEETQIELPDWLER